MEAGLFTLAGVILGSVLTYLLTRSWQREQWLRDRRVQEWKELLSGMTEALRTMLIIYPARNPTDDEKGQIIRTATESMKIIRDRLFIAEEVERMNIENRWSAAIQDHAKTLSARALADVYSALRKEILNDARKGH